MWNHLCLPQTLAPSYHAVLDQSPANTEQQVFAVRLFGLNTPNSRIYIWKSFRWTWTIIININYMCRSCPSKPENSRFVLECEKSWNELIYYHTIIIQRESLKSSHDTTSKISVTDLIIFFASSILLKDVGDG